MIAKCAGRAPYTVTVADRYGEFLVSSNADFDAAFMVASLFRERYPRHAVVVCNQDRADYDTDGLTEEQREAVR